MWVWGPGAGSDLVAPPTPDGGGFRPFRREVLAYALGAVGSDLKPGRKGLAFASSDVGVQGSQLLLSQNLCEPLPLFSLTPSSLLPPLLPPSPPSWNCSTPALLPTEDPPLRVPIRGILGPIHAHPSSPILQQTTSEIPCVCGPSGPLSLLHKDQKMLLARDLTPHFHGISTTIPTPTQPPITPKKLSTYTDALHFWGPVPTAPYPPSPNLDDSPSTSPPPKGAAPGPH